MSQWTTSRSQQAAKAQYSTPHAHHHPDGVRRLERRNAQTPAAQRSAYTFAHGGRQVRFGPVVFWIAVGTVVIMAGWSITAATYLAFRDDVLRTLIAHQADQQFAYEDRIAELRAQIDRTTSRQLLDQEQFEQKLNDLMHRQAILEQRASALGGVADPVTTGSIKSRSEPVTRGADGKQSSLGVTLGRLASSLDRVEQRQSMALARLDDRYVAKARLLRGVLTQLGVKVDTPEAGVGGPFIPVKLPAENESFQRALMRVSLARAESDRLSIRLNTVPLRKPVAGEIDETSPFGVRMDPFVHEAAMHTGIDFRGEMGEPIHATAAGTVSIASWTGGYGKMVEIDHGNGLATRYGHLSEIDVGVGDKVRIGQVIGKLGSTGRSTGPHVHYETRIDGAPVNPQKFLDAGDKLFGG
jgi:murein DD-endopeptidase MepM/ murein hydrolase activator NlpD